MISTRVLLAGIRSSNVYPSIYRRLLSSATSEHAVALNPPTSTLPAPLSTTKRKPDQSQASYLFSVGRSYLSFYKSGLRAVWTNWQSASTLLKQRNLTRSRTALQEAVDSGQISRSEWQLVRRSGRDAARIPLFMLLFAVCGEFTPLVVVFAGALVPHTCLIPRQVEQERQKRAERRKLSFEDVGVERLLEGGRRVDWKLDRMPRLQMLHIGRRLDLYGKIWDLLGGGMPGLVLRGRVARHCSYLAVDDRILRVNGGPETLSDEEICIACEERGLDVIDTSGRDLPMHALRKRLAVWLEMTARYPMGRLLLSDDPAWKDLGADSD